MNSVTMVSNSEGTHLEKLKDMFCKKGERLIIASPFLATNLEVLLDEFSFDNIEKIELITTLKPKDPEQLTKPFVLDRFYKYFKEKYPETKVILHIDNRLHGKIYASSYQDNHQAVLGSANFTRNGLCENHEWGVSLDGNGIIEEIIDDLLNLVEYPDVTHNQIRRACLQAEEYERRFPDWKTKPKITSDILDSVYTIENDKNTEPQYFLKPIGHSEDPILLENKEDFSDLHQNLHFSKRKPKGVRKGDIVITVAVGGGALISYFIVTGSLQHVSAEAVAREPWKERWPWFMEGRNQAQIFGKHWWKFNVRRKETLEEFREKYSHIPITFAGGYNLGTLNRGNDKVRITKEFGEFLISKIVECAGKE